MKNIGYILLLFISAQIIGQEDNPCVFESPSNFFEHGLLSSSEGTQVIANDIIVPANGQFSINHIEANFFTTPIITDADITYYQDNNGLPGTVLNSMLDVTPTIVYYIGSFGLDIWTAVFDVPPFNFVGGAGMETRYWISVTVSNSEGDEQIYWETKSVDQQGLQPAVFDGSAWMLADTSGGQHMEGVYLFSGECLLDSFHVLKPSVSLIPNPTTDTLLCVHCQEVTEAILYDSSGKKVGTYKVLSEEIIIGNIFSGMYFMELLGPSFKQTVKIMVK